MARTEKENDNLLKEHNKKEERRWRRHWKQLAMILSALVVVGVPIALMMPATTMSLSDAEPYDAILLEEDDNANYGEVDASAQESQPQQAQGVSLEEAVDLIEDHEDPSTQISADEVILEDIDYDHLVIRKRSGADSAWTDVDMRTDKAGLADELEITLRGYTLPANFLWAERKTISYRLPEQLIFDKKEEGKIREAKAESEKPEEIGTYTIDTDRIMTLSFDDAHVQKNADGEMLTADLTFTAYLDEAGLQGDAAHLEFAKDREEILHVGSNEVEVPEEVQPETAEQTETVAPVDAVDETDAEATEAAVEKETDEAKAESEKESESESETEKNTEKESEQESETETETETENGMQTLSLGTDFLMLNQMFDAESMKVVNADGGEIDFTQWISGVTLQKSTGWERWEDIKDGKIHENDNLRFRVEYTIPANQLDRTHKTIKYTIPQGLTVKNAQSGKVSNSQGQEMGTYRIEGDTIYIEFYDTIADQNAAGQAVNGFVTFEANVDQSKTDDKGDGTIKFSDTVKLDFHNEDKKVTTEDLKVQKTAIDVNESTGTITYKIEVTSQNGTASEVTLTDVMQNVQLDGKIRVEGIPNANVLKTEKGFNLTLPQMNAGGKYTITYTAKLNDDMVNGTVQANNKVAVDSTRNDGAKLHDDQEVRTDIKHEILNKEGKLEDGKMKWTITINDAGMDIGGWTLSDQLNDIPFTDTVNISPAVNGQTQITLPYTFPEGSKQKYTITYETDPEKKMGIDQAINTAILKPKDGKPITKDGWGYIGDGVFNPLKKVAGITDASNRQPDTEGNIILPWTLTVDTTQGPIPAGWKLYDELENRQWYTSEQLQTFMNKFSRLKYTMKAWLLQPNGEKGDEVTSLTSGLKYKAIELTFTDALAKGNKYEVTYNSTAPVGSGSKLDFFNKATINDQFENKPQIIYQKTGQPSIKKYDTNGVEGDTQHELTETEKPSWYIELTIPDGYNGGKLYVDEILPKGVTLRSLSYEKDDQQVTIPATESGNTIEYQIDSQYSNIIHISIPENIANNSSGQNKMIKFKIEVDIKVDEVTWTKNNGKEISNFKNEVQVLDKDKKKIDGDTQTQEFSRKAEEPIVGKSVGTVKDNIIPYTLVINPDGKDLIPDVDTLTLTDELKYQPWNGVWWTATLVPGSVHVYHRNSDGTQGQELTALEFTQLYQELEDASDPNNPPKYTRKLTLTVPDAKALIIKYNYLIHGTIDRYPSFSNTATLSGVSGKGTSSGTSTQVHIQQSSAGADTEGTNISIFKVDSENTGIGLQGAKFHLFRWDQNDNKYQLVGLNGSNELTTGSDGLIKLPTMAYNTAYKLEEIQAPNGYEKDKEPYFFYVENADKQKHPEVKPVGFKGEKRYAGDTLYRPNTKNTTSLKIQKKWLKADGTDLNKPNGSINVQIQRREKDNPDADWKNYEQPISIKCEDQTNKSLWVFEKDDLPAFDKDGNPYEYRVQELPTAGYEVSYDENNKGIASGTITITNTEQKTYHLPETGGSGTYKYIISGLALMLGAATLLYKKRKNMWKEAV